ncbi:MAG: Glycosyl transferase family protein [Parcubacteria group bacterium GW2011_GWA2_56_7]|nr:MAG: Glycosyl transferase family protein [Parcubacteria group bacterium GW2011_GWA2_56_7]
MSMPKVSFHVVTWNGIRYLPDLFASMEKQTWREMLVRMADNGSDDGTWDVLSSREGVTSIRNARNLGFAVGHNQLIRFALDKWVGEDLAHSYIVVANQDIVLDAGFIEQAVSALEGHPKAGSVQGKLLRAFIEHPEDEYLTETICADVIDSTGLRPTWSLRFVDRGAGELDEGQYDEGEEVFGATGALTVYRAQALVDVRFQDEFFDADFFMYKEDVDLAWRLRKAGWVCLYVPTALAYHHRGLFGKERMTWKERLQTRRFKRPFLALLSTRNQYLMLWKHMGGLLLLWSLPFLLFVETRQLVYTVLFERNLLRGLFAGWRLVPRMLKKRRAIKRAPGYSFREVTRFLK